MLYFQSYLKKKESNSNINSNKSILYSGQAKTYPFFTLKNIYTWNKIEFEDYDYLNLIFKRLYLLDMIMLSLI